MTQAEFNAWIRARFNLWTKSDVDAAIKAEREACAKIVQVHLDGNSDLTAKGSLASVLDYIRTRGDA